MKILGIETSCDETGVAICEGGRITQNLLYSQLALHRKTGGIVPEVAARAQVEKIYRLLSRVELKKIDAIAVTVGPGLIGSLLVGVETARTLAYLLGKPVIAVNHLEGHMFSALAEKISNIVALLVSSKTPIKYQLSNYFPMLSLIVSGGHTELVLVKSVGRYEVIGRTLDDAAGECFDKVGRLLGLPYPGGPSIAKEAMKYHIINSTYQIILPRPMIESKDYNFSFAGLKTAVLYRWQALTPAEQKKLRPAFAYETEQAIVDVLVTKTLRAAKALRPTVVTIGGGVASNRKLRQRMRDAILAEPRMSASSAPLYLEPNLDWATDNAAMIAYAGWLLAEQRKNRLRSWRSLEVRPVYPLEWIDRGR